MVFDWQEMNGVNFSCCLAAASLDSNSGVMRFLRQDDEVKVGARGLSASY